MKRKHNKSPHEISYALALRNARDLVYHISDLTTPAFGWGPDKRKDLILNVERALTALIDYEEHQ